MNPKEAPVRSPEWGMAVTPLSPSSLGPSLPPWLGPQATPIPSVSHGWGHREDLGWGQGQGGAESLSHLVSEVSRPLPSLVPVDPSQPLLSPIHEFSALPKPLPSLLPSTPVWPWRPHLAGLQLRGRPQPPAHSQRWVLGRQSRRE